MKIKYGLVDTEKEKISMLLRMFKNGEAATVNYSKEESLKVQAELYRIGYQWYDRGAGATENYFVNEDKGLVHFLRKANHKDGGKALKGRVLCCCKPSKIDAVIPEVFFNAKILLDNIVEFENLDNE